MEFIYDKDEPWNLLKINPCDSYYPIGFWSFSEIEGDTFTNMGFATLFNAPFSETIAP